jgi:hypothetical protein
LKYGNLEVHNVCGGYVDREIRENYFKTEIPFERG